MFIASIWTFLASIPAWGWCDLLSTLLVLIGVCGEWSWLMSFFIQERPNDLLPIDRKKKKLEKRLLVVLIIGVAGELACIPFSLWESSKLNDEAGNARKDAGEAKVLASQIGTTNAQLVASNLNLSIKLERLKQPRIISVEKEKRFILLCKEMPKMPIKIIVGFNDNEAEVFAEQVRQTLDEAGFGGPDAGIYRDSTLFMTTPIGTTGFSPIDLMKNDTNMIGSIDGPVYPRTPQEQIVADIGLHFGDIGFKSTWFLGDANQYLKTGEAAIFIPPKSLGNQ